MKKVVASALGNIYYANILKDGTMGQDKVDVTDDCLFATMQHLQAREGFDEKGFAGYTYANKRDSSKSMTLAVYDEKHTCIEKSTLESLREKVARLTEENERLEEQAEGYGER